MILFAAAAVSLALTAPTFVAVSDASRSRPFAPLSDWSDICAGLAAAIAAVAAAAQVAALPQILGWSGGFILVAPPVIGAAPWAAGELCAGPSPRQEEALAAAEVMAYLAAILAEIASGSIAIQASSSALAATAAYLVTRGRTQ